MKNMQADISANVRKISSGKLYAIMKTSFGISQQNLWKIKRKILDNLLLLETFQMLAFRY